MSLVEDKVKLFLEQIESLKKDLPIDRTLLLTYWQLFKEFENSPIVMDYLIQHKEINIDTILNTKTVFHILIFEYIQKMDNLTRKAISEPKDISIHINRLSDTLVDIAKIEVETLKLPTIEEIRDPSLIEKKLKEQNENSSK